MILLLIIIIIIFRLHFCVEWNVFMQTLRLSAGLANLLPWPDVQVIRVSRGGAVSPANQGFAIVGVCGVVAQTEK